MGLERVLTAEISLSESVQIYKIVLNKVVVKRIHYYGARGGECDVVWEAWSLRFVIAIRKIKIKPRHLRLAT